MCAVGVRKRKRQEDETDDSLDGQDSDAVLSDVRKSLLHRIVTVDVHDLTSSRVRVVPELPSVEERCTLVRALEDWRRGRLSRCGRGRGCRYRCEQADAMKQRNRTYRLLQCSRAPRSQSRIRLRTAKHSDHLHRLGLHQPARKDCSRRQQSRLARWASKSPLWARRMLWLSELHRAGASTFRARRSRHRY